MVKRIGSSSRGPRFDSYSHMEATPSVTLVSGALTSALDLSWHCMHVVHKHMEAEHLKGCYHVSVTGPSEKPSTKIFIIGNRIE